MLRLRTEEQGKAGRRKQTTTHCVVQEEGSLVKTLQTSKVALRIWQDRFHELLDARNLAQSIRRDREKDAREQHLRPRNNAEAHNA